MHTVSILCAIRLSLRSVSIVFRQRSERIYWMIITQYQMFIGLMARFAFRLVWILWFWFTEPGSKPKPKNLSVRSMMVMKTYLSYWIDVLLKKYSIHKIELISFWKSIKKCLQYTVYSARVSFLCNKYIISYNCTWSNAKIECPPLCRV